MSNSHNVLIDDTIVFKIQSIGYQDASRIIVKTQPSQRLQLFPSLLVVNLKEFNAVFKLAQFRLAGWACHITDTLAPEISIINPCQKGIGDLVRRNGDGPIRECGRLSAIISLLRVKLDACD